MKKRIVAICLCAVLLLGVVGTMAYFTDEDSATNTFTVGKVNILLDEADITDLNITLIQSYLKEVGSSLYEESKTMEFLDLCKNMNIVNTLPEYTKPKKRGEGTTKQPSWAPKPWRTSTA